MSKVLCRTQLRTRSINDDPEYTESVLSKNFIGELAKNRVLDRNVEKEKETRILLYKERLDNGLSIFEGEPLSNIDMISVRGYGDMRLGTALNKLRAEDKLLDFELDHE